jgi:hypothetical protein
MMINEKIKQNITETIKLLWQFKWYVAFDLLFLIFLVTEYFNPPATDDPIWGSEAMYGVWNFQNQQLYIQSCKYSLIISTLFFLIGTSNMRNHPILAKIIFSFPLYLGWMKIL